MPPRAEPGSVKIQASGRPIAMAGATRPLRFSATPSATNPPSHKRFEGMAAAANGSYRAAAGERSARIAHTGRPGSGSTIGKPVRMNLGGGGPPHWLIVVGSIGHLRAW